MIISFPRMGTMHIPIKLLFDRLGVEVLVPPPTTKKTLELGIKYSPETVCLPFKISLGNFIEALSAGADTLVTCGGVGPCRLGYYGEVQKSILTKLGFAFNFLVLEPDVLETFPAMRKLFPGRNWFEIYQAVRLMWAAFQSLDRIERQVCYVRCRAVEATQVEAIWRQALVAIEQAGNVSEMQKKEEFFCRQLAQIPVRPDYRPLQLGLIGEIYTLLEPFVNHDLVRHLGEMGIDVHNSIYLTDYMQVHLLKNRKFCRKYREMLKHAAPFLAQGVGGHGRLGIGNAVQMAQDGYDGVIQVLPFTCMPEIIAKNILPQIGKTYDIPILSLTFDEQSGEAGILTRLEAFVDLLKYRQAKWQDTKE